MPVLIVACGGCYGSNCNCINGYFSVYYDGTEEDRKRKLDYINQCGRSGMPVEQTCCLTCKSFNSFKAGTCIAMGQCTNNDVKKHMSEIDSPHWILTAGDHYCKFFKRK